MNRFIGVATIALLAHSGAALAQPVLVAPPDDGPRLRVERPGGAESRNPETRGSSETRGSAERQAQERRSEPSSRTQRGAGSDEQRAQDGPRSQQRDRDQAQRERPAQPDARSPEPQRAQTPKRDDDKTQRDQAQRDKAPDANRAQTEPAKPDSRSLQSAEPQKTETQRSTDTVRPAAQPGQPSGDTATQRSAPQPGSTTAGAPASDTQPTTNTAGAPASTTQPTTNTAATSSGNEAEQRIATTVREQIERKEISPVSDFGVSVSVGAELPSRVQLQPLPSDIAAIRPQYRDYRFTVSEKEIVIVDPRTRRIVEVIDRSGGRGGADVYTVFEQRRDIRRWERPTSIVFREGIELPASAPYYDVPVEIVERNPQWRGHKYVMTSSDEIAIVEPRSRRIVEVVDRSDGGMRNASAGGASSSQPAMASAPRNGLARMILNAARPGDINTVDSLKGVVLPQDVIMQPLPTEVAERESQLRGLNYALLGDEVLIVEPNTRRVVDVIK